MNSIYQYKNKINGHMYIGMAKDASRRFHEHLLASQNENHKEYNYPIHAAIRKYGIDNFEFNILEDNLPDLQTMKEHEIYWIKYYNTYENRQHYNETPGGDCVGEKNVHIGEKHGMAKLSEEDVIFCRKAYKNGERSRQIYEKYFTDKIAYSGFLRMWHGKNWKHVMPEVFSSNPHPKKYGAKDRDLITALFEKSGLSLSAFSKSKECYVGYGTLYNMIYNPKFYDNK